MLEGECEMRDRARHVRAILVGMRNVDREFFLPRSLDTFSGTPAGSLHEIY